MKVIILTYFILPTGCSTDDPCENGGTCMKGICHCPSDFIGTRCQHNGKRQATCIQSLISTILRSHANNYPLIINLFSIMQTQLVAHLRVVLVQHAALLHLEDQFVSASLDGRGILLGDANPNELNQLSSIKFHHQLEYSEVTLRCIQKHIVAYIKFHT